MKNLPGSPPEKALGIFPATLVDGSFMLRLDGVTFSAQLACGLLFIPE